MKENQPPMHRPDFPSFEHSSAESPNSVQWNLLMNIPLHVSVELGRTKQTIGDILKLGRGSIIELDKMAGEPVDILVNGKLIALGEVVVIDEKFGVRITQMLHRLDGATILNQPPSSL